jgi:predicted permease
MWAQFCVPLLIGLAPGNLPQAQRISMDWSVLMFAAVVSMLTGILFGFLPALQNMKLDISSRLRTASTRTATHGSGNRARKILIAGEVAISLVLLIGAGLLLQTFWKLSAVNPGFSTKNVLTAKMSVSAEQFRTTAANALLERRVETRLEATPGVLAAGTITTLPTEPGFDDPFEIIGRPSKEIQDASLRAVSAHYFSALQIPVVAGRPFTEQDTQQARRVIIVNEAFAEKYFPHQTAVGQQLLIGRVMGPAFADVPREIVGVVGDTHDAGLAAPPDPTYFEPLTQLPDAVTALGNQLVPMNWVIRTAGDPLAMAPVIRREALAASGTVPMAEPRLLDQVVGSSIARQRFSMTLLAIFAGLAVLLCAIGLYGVVSYSATQRTRELGIRAALGAGQVDLLKLVIGQGMWMVVIGLTIGLIAASGLTRFLQGMLFGVEAFDPLTMASVTILLGVVALVACWLPARRAAKVDSAIALRDE